MDRIALARELTRLAKAVMGGSANEITVGMKVKYSRNFLRSIGDYGDLAHQTGIVKAIKDLGGLQIAEVDWDKDAPSKVNVKNLIPASRVHLEPV